MITTSVSEAVAIVQLNRPDARNALTRDMMNDLAAQLVALDSDESVRCIVLTGAEDRKSTRLNSSHT